MRIMLIFCRLRRTAGSNVPVDGRVAHRKACTPSKAFAADGPRIGGTLITVDQPGEVLPRRFVNELCRFARESYATES
jgi:hypothetical protein